jgi:Ca2+-transporting ATPase
MMLLAGGATELARRNAIVKRLPSVETLGSVSAICSDKTGTLTLNRMTAREMAISGYRFSISGEGYSTEGEIRSQGEAEVDLGPFMLPLALCTDAVLDGEELVGDPTEGALIVLAEKGGVDVGLAREAYPRVAELPFDSEYKLMATFHEMSDESGRDVVRCFVKGAPDVLIARGADVLGEDGVANSLDGVRQRVSEGNAKMAERGLRVLVTARRDFDRNTFDPEADHLKQMTDLTLLSMVGIVDPPRPEAKQSVAEAHRAGIEVRMITGDHAVTAAAIGEELGIAGRALTGAEFSAMSDDELVEQLDDIAVVARVAPEDKIRLVQLLQGEGNIVAMTGDGVNDAPALKEADIGVAMGITGTEVSKQAAEMILTDDDFATIVRAVEFGRGLYDNLLKYLRFAMSKLFGYVLLFLIAAITGIAGGVPIGPMQTIYLNFFVDGPLAVGLGFGEQATNLMDNPPRSLDEPVFRPPMWIRVAFYGLVMAIVTLSVRVWATGEYGSETTAATVSIVTLSFMHIYNAWGSIDTRASAFSRASVPDASQFKMLGLTILFTVLMVELPLLQRLFGMESLSLSQWLMCAGFALVLLVIDEAIKFVLRHVRPEPEAVSETA